MISFTVVQLVAAILTLGIPIVAIICGAVIAIRKKQEEVRIRQSIIDNHVDAEVAKLLVEEKAPKKDTNVALRWGCLLAFGGIAGIIVYILSLYDGRFAAYDMIKFVFIACGCGLGLLTSFLIEYKLREKAAPKDE